MHSMQECALLVQEWCIVCIAHCACVFTALQERRRRSVVCIGSQEQSEPHCGVQEVAGGVQYMQDLTVV